MITRVMLLWQHPLNKLDFILSTIDLVVWRVWNYEVY